ncbi:MAG: hypothetical protein HUU35_16485 [Armatimonadetes bacterium]|nr:hypothetical protein [Armatimonadota bacterium]
MHTEMVSTPRVTEFDGVSGEFHSQGNLLLAARTARRAGLPGERMWLIGDPAEDHAGAPMGFVIPVSFVREMAISFLLMGALFGAITSGSLYWTGWADAARKIPVGLVVGGLTGGLVGMFCGWAAISARIGAYLFNARAGTLRLKIGIPPSSETERERLAEAAERVLRKAHAESISRLDGAVEVNSPQSPAYVA